MSLFALAACLVLAHASGETDWLDDFLAGSRALEEGRIADARASFERSAHALPTHAPSAYQLACALARGGDVEAALAQLGRAVALGYDDPAVIRWDGDLQLLHEDPRFEFVLASLPDRSSEARPDFQTAWFPYWSQLSSTPDFAHVSSPVAIWDVRSGSVLASLPGPGKGSIFDADCGLDGRFVFTSGSLADRVRFVRVHDTATGDVVRDLPEIVQLSDGRKVWSRDLSAVYRSSTPPYMGDASLSWTRTAGAVVLESSTGRVVSSLGGIAREEPVAVAPDGRTFWTSSFGCLREVDAANARSVREIALDSRRILALAIRPDGEEIAAVDSAGVLHVVQSKSGAVSSIPIEVFQKRREGSIELEPLRPSGRWIQLSYAPDGRHCAVWTGSEGMEVLETSDWRVRERFVVDTRIVDLQGKPTNGGEITAFAWSPSGDRFATCTLYGPVRVFDLTSEPAARLEFWAGVPRTVAFEPNSNHLWIGNREAKVDVRDLGTTERVRTFDLLDAARIQLEIGSITFLPGGELVVVATDNFGYDTVVAWRLRDGKRMWTLDAQDNGDDRAPGVLVSGSGKRLLLWAWGSLDGFHDVEPVSGEGSLLLERGLRSPAFARSERRLIGRGDQGTEIIDANTGATRVSRVELPAAGWLLHTPSGFFDGTRAGLDAFHLSLPDRSYALDGLAAAIVDPKKVAASAAGVAVAPVRLRQPPTLVWTSPTPRTLEVDGATRSVELELEATSADGVAALEVIVDGERSLHDRLDVAVSPRRFTLELAATDELDVRLRSIDANGIASRPLHLTIDVR